MSGSSAAIGAPCHATATVPDAGGVYRFSTISAIPTPPLSAAVAAPDDLFGSAVALSGDTILVGAPRRDTGGATAAFGARSVRVTLKVGTSKAKNFTVKR